MAFGHPVFQAIGPGGDGQGGGGAKAEAVFAAGVDVHFGGDALLLERQVLIDGDDDMRGVVVGADEEGGRRVFGDGDDGVGAPAGIDEDGEVGARAGLVGGIGRVGVAGAETGFDESGEFTASRKADEADALRIDGPFFGAGADDAHGSRGIGESVALHGVVGIGGAGEAVLEDEGGDAKVVEPVGDLPTFFVDDELGMASAGCDDDGRAIGFVLGREEDV